MIRKATLTDLDALAVLSCSLWPHHSSEEMAHEMEGLLHKENCVLFLALEDSLPVGFAQCQLRRDYVEGTASSPVGYLEGIYVSPDHRNHSIARGLLLACEDWSREMGCSEFASDCELTNQESLAFHMHLGFSEANRIICFTKKL